jgi:K+ transporter
VAVLSMSKQEFNRLVAARQCRSLTSELRPGMARWREHLYSGLARIATRSTDFLPDRLIELGAEVEI